MGFGVFSHHHGNWDSSTTIMGFGTTGCHHGTRATVVPCWDSRCPHAMMVLGRPGSHSGNIHCSYIVHVPHVQSYNDINTITNTTRISIIATGVQESRPLCASCSSLSALHIYPAGTICNLHANTLRAEHHQRNGRTPEHSFIHLPSIHLHSQTSV
jgi:hypothetical protein